MWEVVVTFVLGSILFYAGMVTRDQEIRDACVDNKPIVVQNLTVRCDIKEIRPRK